MKKTKNAGITLVALVITIIILLILAGITISQLTGSGLFEKAQFAEERSKNAQEKEEGILSDYENKIGEYINSDRASIPANSENTMSGTEHFTGEYYFNGKPIYAKTIYIESLPNATYKTYNHGIEDIDTIWLDLQNYIMYSNTANNYWTPVYMNSVDGDAKSFTGISNINETDFRIYTGYDRSTLSAYITFRYTKTTDQSNGNTITATPANKE